MAARRRRDDTPRDARGPCERARSPERDGAPQLRSMRELQRAWAAGEATAWVCVAAWARRRIPRGWLGVDALLRTRDDWVSEVILRAMKDGGAAIRRARPETDIGAWVRGIVRHIGMDARRRAGKRRCGTEDAARARAAPSLVESTPSSPSPATSPGWARLTPRQRALLSARREDGLTYRQLAGVFGASVGCVRKQVRAALQVLERSRAPALGDDVSTDPSRSGDTPGATKTVDAEVSAASGRDRTHRRGNGTAARPRGA